MYLSYTLKGVLGYCVENSCWSKGKRGRDGKSRSRKTRLEPNRVARCETTEICLVYSFYSFTINGLEYFYFKCNSFKLTKVWRALWSGLLMLPLWPIWLSLSCLCHPDLTHTNCFAFSQYNKHFSTSKICTQSFHSYLLSDVIYEKPFMTTLSRISSPSDYHSFSL